MSQYDSIPTVFFKCTKANILKHDAIVILNSNSNCFYYTISQHIHHSFSFCTELDIDQYHPKTIGTTYEDCIQSSILPYGFEFEPIADELSTTVYQTSLQNYIYKNSYRVAYMTKGFNNIIYNIIDYKLIYNFKTSVVNFIKTSSTRYLYFFNKNSLVLERTPVKKRANKYLCFNSKEVLPEEFQNTLLKKLKQVNYNKYILLKNYLENKNHICFNVARYFLKTPYVFSNYFYIDLLYNSSYSNFIRQQVKYAFTTKNPEKYIFKKFFNITDEEVIHEVVNLNLLKEFAAYFVRADLSFLTLKHIYWLYDKVQETYTARLLPFNNTTGFINRLSFGKIVFDRDLYKISEKELEEYE